jgi:SP family galactose:H+ symporter-like MFS transporter
LVVIASSQLTGINAIFLYAKQLFLEITDKDILLSQQLMLGLALCQLLSCTFSGKFIDSFGRKYLLIKGQAGIILVLWTIFVVDSYSSLFRKDIYNYLLIALLYIHIIIFNFTLGPVCIIYAAELVTNITPIIVTKRLVNLMVAASTNYLIHEFGIGPMFLLYGMLSLVAHTYLRDRIRETKGKSKIQIL